MLYNMDTVHHSDEEVASSDWDYQEIIWQDLRRGEEDGVLQK
jgi:hypothetical protein